MTAAPLEGRDKNRSLAPFPLGCQCIEDAWFEERVIARNQQPAVVGTRAILAANGRERMFHAAAHVRRSGRRLDGNRSQPDHFRAEPFIAGANYDEPFGDLGTVQGVEQAGHHRLTAQGQEQFRSAHAPALTGRRNHCE